MKYQKIEKRGSIAYKKGHFVPKRHLHVVWAVRMNCQYCGRVFNRGYNFRRHEDEYCPYREQDNSSDDCSPAKKSRGAEGDEDDVSSSSCDENSEYSEDDDEIKEEIDPWVTLIEDAKAIVRS